MAIVWKRVEESETFKEARRMIEIVASAEEEWGERWGEVVSFCHFSPLILNACSDNDEK